MRFLIGSEEGINPCLVSTALSLKPIDNISIYAQGQLGFAIDRLPPLWTIALANMTGVISGELEKLISASRIARMRAQSV
jgi:hypothetical protein